MLFILINDGFSLEMYYRRKLRSVFHARDNQVAEKFRNCLRNRVPPSVAPHCIIDVVLVNIVLCRNIARQRYT